MDRRLPPWGCWLTLAVAIGCGAPSHPLPTNPISHDRAAARECDDAIRPALAMLARRRYRDAIGEAIKLDGAARHYLGGLGYALAGYPIQAGIEAADLRHQSALETEFDRLMAVAFEVVLVGLDPNSGDEQLSSASRHIDECCQLPGDGRMPAPTTADYWLTFAGSLLRARGHSPHCLASIPDVRMHAVFAIDGSPQLAPPPGIDACCALQLVEFRPLIDIAIGAHRYRFLFDTGASINIAIGPELIDRLLLTGQQLEVEVEHPTTGTRVVDVYLTPEVVVAEFLRAQEAMVSWPFATGDLETPELDGVLGVSAVAPRAVTLDYQQGTMSFSRGPNPTTRWDFSVEARVNESGFLELPARIAGREAFLLADTGVTSWITTSAATPVHAGDLVEVCGRPFPVQGEPGEFGVTVLGAEFFASFEQVCFDFSGGQVFFRDRRKPWQAE